MGKFVFRTRSLGALTDDLREVASTAALLCRRRAVTIWVDHEHEVFADTPSMAANVPPDWIVGTYRGEAAGIPSIEADLHEMCRQRATQL